MMTIKEGLTNLKKQNDTIEAILALGKIARGEDGILKHGEFKIKTVYSDGASIITATAENKGDYFPTHVHEGIIQYLICFKGSFIVDFVDDNRHRYLYEKDCVSIPADVRHKVTALNAGASLIGVCIPVDKSYTLKDNR